MLRYMRSRALRASIRAAVLFAAVLGFGQEGANPVVANPAVANPWPASAILEPVDLAKTVRSPEKKPAVICVAFPVLYRGRHITDAVFAGPGNRPEGIEALKKAVAGMPKDRDLVLYCGCCPMTRCPNIRPSYQALKELGFTRIRVLSIPTNMATDWYEKGYPSEAGSAGVPGQ